MSVVDRQSFREGSIFYMYVSFVTIQIISSFKNPSVTEQFQHILSENPGKNHLGLYQCERMAVNFINQV